MAQTQLLVNTHDPSQTAKRRVRVGKARWVQLASLAGFFAIWQWVASAGFFPGYILPAPTKVFEALVKEWQSGNMIKFIGLSLQHYVPGMLWGIALGTALGVTTAWYKTLEIVLEPVLRILRPIPPLAWIPFAIMWFGLTQTAAAFIIFVVAFWINYYNSYTGIKGVDKGLLDAARALGTTSSWKLVVKVALPHAAPTILTGIRSSIGQGWMAIVAAELLGVGGVGLHMQEAAGYLAMHIVTAYMLVLGILFSVSDGVFRSLENWLLRWRA